MPKTRDWSRLPETEYRAEIERLDAQLAAMRDAYVELQLAWLDRYLAVRAEVDELRRKWDE